MRKVKIMLLFSMLLQSCLPESELQLEFTTYVPQALNDSIQISTPFEERMDPNVLTNIFRDFRQEEEFWSIRSFLVFRNGKLIAEDYLMDEEDLTTPHLIWSCTKQVMAMLMVKALADGHIQDLEDPISDYLDSELQGHEDKASITLKQLLTMRSGIDFENGGLSGESNQLLQQIPDNSVEFILNLPMADEPDERFHYNDGNPHLLSAILQKQLGHPVDAWADKVLFSRIGFENYDWRRYRDGTTLGAFGIETTPRELAKLAMLVANHGRWGDRQLLPVSGIANMLTAQTETTESGYQMGYYWWLEPERNIYFMNGHGGQFAFIIPNQSLVVVSTAIPNTDGSYQIEADELMPVLDRLVAACR